MLCVILECASVTRCLIVGALMKGGTLRQLLVRHELTAGDFLSDRSVGRTLK